MIKRIEIENIGKFESLVIEPGAVTVIEGGNGQGKSTILEILQAIFDGGHQPHLIRDYNKPTAAKKGVVTLLLQDGTSIREVITAKGYELKVMTADGQEVRPPAAYVKRLASGFALDPISFVTAGADAKGWKERQKFFQAAMPANFTAEELSKIGVTGAPPKASYSLEEVEQIRKNAYEQRTDANAKHEQCEATITMLTRSLPADAEGTDYALEEKRISETRKDLEADLGDRLMAIDAEMKEDLDNLRKQYEELVVECRDTYGKRKDEAREAARPSLEANAQELAVVRERAANQSKAKQTREHIALVQTQRTEALRRAHQLDAAVKGIDALKKAKLDSAPIPGLEIRDGRIYVDGLDFDTQLNTAEQYKVAFEIAALNPGEAKLMVCDRAESLEESEFEAFTQGAAASGFQVFLARVTEGPLKIVETVAN